MAIAKMSKISIVGLDSKKSQILKLLMKRGFVQIDDGVEVIAENDELKELVKSGGDVEAVAAFEHKINQISQSIDTVGRYAKVKSSFLAPLPDYTAVDENEAEETFKKALEINEISKKIASLKAETNSVSNQILVLKPWATFDIPFERLETKLSKVTLATMPPSADLAAVQLAFDNAGASAYIEEIVRDKQFLYVFIVAHKSDFENALEVLKPFNFSAVSFNEKNGTVAGIIRDYEARTKEIEAQISKLSSEIESYAQYVGELKNVYDYFLVKRDEKKAEERLIETRRTFCINGWLPTKNANTIQSELTNDHGCFVETSPAEKSEDFPVLLENSSFVTPFEDITNMYSTPSPQGFDPSAIMSVFYIIFFGMMLADAGYGLLLAIACGVIVSKKKMKKGEGNLIKLMCMCGISTFVWGVIFGGCFGFTLPFPAPINPLEDVMLLMGMSLVFGIVHIYIGLGIKGYMYLRDGDVVSFLCDIILWYLFITGVCLLIIPIVAGDIGIFQTIGMYCAIIGAVGIALTGGRKNEGNILFKLFKGVSGLYDITGYFGDILSYTRLMALCLSSGVIAQVVDLLGQMTGPVGLIVIGLIGHAVNLFIGALGAYVHTSRLQFVEFFGKFFEGGGTAFAPFKYRTKYTNINE